MSNEVEPTKLSDDPKSAEVTLVVNTIASDEPSQAGLGTLPLSAPEMTLPFEGSEQSGPMIEPTVAFAPSEVPPSASETVVIRSPETVVDANQTVDLGLEPTVEIARWAATTELISSNHQPYQGETLDSEQADQTTEFVDRSGRESGKPTGARPKPMRNAPNLPGYTILAEIGRGGMGVVYKAWHNRLERPVALKMILAGAHASADQLERFQLEAQAVAQIQYPGIVQIYDVGEQDGLPFFSLEFVSGGSLDKKLGGRPQPATEAATMVRKLALAMHQAHSRKIIHRDLKPANVLLTPEGEPKITDFGLAKRLEDDSHQTRSGAIMGTPSYMAPEQAWGQTREIGYHTDQYALGTILYEMLVGHVPFQGATALETLELARTQEPIPPRRLQPKIPVDLETICLKCLQKEPSKRYGDVSILADELGRFLEGRPIHARPVGKAERAVRWCRRNPKIAGLGAAVAVLLLAVSIGSTAFAFLLNAKNDELEKSNKAESIAKKEAQAKEAAAIAAQKETEKARGKEAEARALAEKKSQEFQKIATNAIDLRSTFLETQKTISILLNLDLRNIEGTQALREKLIGVVSDNLRNYLMVIDRLAGIVEDKDGDLKTKKMLASLNLQAGRLMEDYDRYDEAVKYFEQVDKLAEELIKTHPDDVDPMRVLAVSKGTLGGFQLDRLGNGKAALEHFQKTLAIRREIWKRLPNDEESKRGVCNALGAIARSYLKLGDPAKAREIYLEEVKLRDEFSPQFAAKPVIRSERAGLEEKFGDTCLELNDFAGARKHYDQSLVLREKIVHDHPDNAMMNRDVYLSFCKLGTLDLFDHKPADALKNYEKALAEFERRRKVEPNSLMAKQDVGRGHYYVATARLRLGDLKSADEHYRASLVIREAIETNTKLGAIDVMLCRARCGEHLEAASTARRLCSKPPLDSQIYYFAATGFALCAGSAKGLPPSAENEKLARRYTDEAINALRLAKNAGWKSVGDLQNDPDLDPIRDDPGFATIFKEFQEIAAH